MATPLLKTKLYIPPVRSELVSRPRLIDRLNAGLHRKLTLISAPAGSGKTTLLGEWVARMRDHTAWLSLDDDNNDATRFWAYLIAALQTVHAELGQDVLHLVQAPQPLPAQSILIPLLNEIATLPEQIVLILDDYHVISAQPVHEGITFLLDHQPRQLHVVISTRADPPLPTFRLRARRQLTELRFDDLHFKADETAAFLNEVMGLDLLPEDVEALELRTEGWIVGLQLAALSMQGRENVHEFITAFSGSHHYVLEYLAEEVIHRQPEPVQRFLMQTSILDRLCGPLSDALTERNDGDSILERLHQHNLFIIPLDDEYRWYRYHHLFADLLGNLLREQLPSERIWELHRRASLWYEQRGLLDEAIKHALQAQDFERTASLIEQAASTTLSRGRVTTLLRWSEAIPEELVLARPRLRMYLGWAMFLNGQTSLAKQILQDAKKALQVMLPSPDRKVLHGRLTTLLATLATLHEDMPKAIKEGQEALAHLPEEDMIWRARATRALAVAYGLSGDTNKLIQMCNEAKELAFAAGSIFLAADIISQLALVQLHQGCLQQSARLYQQIIDLVEHPSRFPPAGLGYIGLADISLEWNDLEAAEDYVNRGIELCQQGGIGHHLLPAYCIQAVIRQTSGDTEGALKAIHKAEEMYRATADSLLMAVTLTWYQVRLRLLLNDVEMATRWAKGEMLTSETSFENLPTVLCEVQQVALAQVYLAQDEPEKVLAIYDQLCAPAQAAGRMARVIEISLLKTLALQAQGKCAAAFVSFEQCLSLAEPGGYVRLLLEAGAPVVTLLRQVASHGVSPKYVSKLLAALGIEKESTPTPPRTGTCALVEPLTKRELEVLQLICEGCSNQQISNRLVVTMNTAKKHTSNIYGKLGVKSRTQAVALARQLGLC